MIDEVTTTNLSVSIKTDFPTPYLLLGLQFLITLDLVRAVLKTLLSERNNETSSPSTLLKVARICGDKNL